MCTERGQPGFRVDECCVIREKTDPADRRANAVRIVLGDIALWIIRRTLCLRYGLLSFVRCQYIVALYCTGECRRED